MSPPGSTGAAAAAAAAGSAGRRSRRCPRGRSRDPGTRRCLLSAHFRRPPRPSSLRSLPFPAAAATSAPPRALPRPPLRWSDPPSRRTPTATGTGTAGTGRTGERPSKNPAMTTTMATSPAVGRGATFSCPYRRYSYYYCCCCSLQLHSPLFPTTRRCCTDTYRRAARRESAMGRCCTWPSTRACCRSPACRKIYRWGPRAPRGRPAVTSTAPPVDMRSR